MVEELQEESTGLLDKASQLLGVDKRYVLPGLGLFAISTVAIIVLGVAAIGDLRSQFFDDPQESNVAGRIEMRSQQSVTIEEGEPLPAIEGAAGRSDACSDELAGKVGWERGWVWDPSSNVCRRVREINGK